MRFEKLLTAVVIFAFILQRNIIFSQVQPKIYLNLNSHNENALTETWDNAISGYYLARYDTLVKIANMVISKNAKWNFQSDVKFLIGCINIDPDTLQGSKNLLKWMDDSPNIECDPHSHEGTFMGAQYNYADIAHLHDSLGVTNRKNAGGFKVDSLQNGSDWQSFEAGMTGVKFPFYTWQPNVLWGGSFGQGIHNDMNFYGCYKPLSRANYYHHDFTKRVRIQGNGCSAHLTDSTNIDSLIGQIKDLSAKIQNGQYPYNQFYTQSIQFDCRDILSSGFLNKLSVILDSMNALVARGEAVWMNIGQKDSLWIAGFAADSMRIDCDALPLTGMETLRTDNFISIYPNPSQGMLSLSFPFDQVPSNVEIFNLSGEKMADYPVFLQQQKIDISQLSPGLYFVKGEANGKSFFAKLIRE